MKKIDGCVGRSDGIFDENVRVVLDSRKVAVRKIDNGTERVVEGGIVIPETTEMNNRMARGIVVSASDYAREEYGLGEGDEILFDRLAVYYDTDPVCVVDFENIICHMDGDTPFPMKNMILTREVKKDTVDMGGIIVDGGNPLEVPVGKIEASATDDFDAGEYVLLSTGADLVVVKGVTYRIYKDEMVLAKLEMDKAEEAEYEYR